MVNNVIHLHGPENPGLADSFARVSRAYTSALVEIKNAIPEDNTWPRAMCDVLIEGIQEVMAAAGGVALAAKHLESFIERGVEE